MEEIDIKTCLKKIKTKQNQKNIVKSFSLSSYKNRTKNLDFS